MFQQRIALILDNHLVAISASLDTQAACMRRVLVPLPETTALDQYFGQFVQAFQNKYMRHTDVNKCANCIIVWKPTVSYIQRMPLPLQNSGRCIVS